VTQGARDARNSSVRMQYKALLQCMMTIGPSIFTGKNVKFHGGFWQKCRISRNFLLFFEPPTPLTCTKAYLRSLMSLAVILLLTAMLTAGPDRLYRLARSHVQL